MAYMISLFFRGTRISYHLLLFFVLPIFFETDFILGLWLGSVPEYTTLFTRLVLVNSLLESFTYLMGTAIQATGEVKWYQIIIGGTLLLNVPISYLFLRAGYSPSVVFVVLLIISTVTLFLRLAILRAYLCFSLSGYLVQVLGRAALSTFVACLLPLFLKYGLTGVVIPPIAVIVCSGASTLFTAAYLGLSRSERLYLLNVIKRNYARIGGENL
jgi:hypothetical protein